MHIALKKLSFKYPEAIREVFRDLSCRIDGPGFHALFGPSGVGKTTLARMMTGELDGFSGEITATGIRQILYTYNLERLPGWSSVREHLEATTPASNQDMIDDLADAFGLKPFVQSRFAQLSLGQQNRMNLVRYLLQEFDLLIMDESLANVDEMTKEKIILKIKTMFPNRGFLYISHNVVEVAKFCKHIMVLRGNHKTPQAVMLRGQDYINGRTPENSELEHTMLEIVNAY